MTISIFLFLMLSCLPFIIYWVIMEKTEPFYEQSKSAWYFVVYTLLISLALNIYFETISVSDADMVSSTMTFLADKVVGTVPDYNLHAPSLQVGFLKDTLAIIENDCQVYMRGMGFVDTSTPYIYADVLKQLFSQNAVLPIIGQLYELQCISIEIDGLNMSAEAIRDRFKKAEEDPLDPNNQWNFPQTWFVHNLHKGYITPLVLVSKNPSGFLYWSSMFVLDSYSSVLRSLVLFFSAVSGIYAYYYTKMVRLNYFELPLYILFSVLGMLVLVSSNNLLLTYVAIELQSFCFYLLAAAQRKSILSVEVGLKYLFVGSVGSGFLLLAFSILYHTFGTIDMQELSILMYPLQELNNHTASVYVLASFFCIVIGFFIKLGVAPFHLWVADVYEGAPTMSSIYFLIVPKLVMFGVFFRFLYTVYPVNFVLHSNYIFFICCIVLCFFAGYLGALQRGITLKRFYAFSGISHLGFLLLPFVSPSVPNYSMLEEIGDLLPHEIVTKMTMNSYFYPIFYYVILYAIINVVAVRLLLNFIQKTDLTSGRNIHYVLESLPANYNLVNPAHSLAVFLLFIIFIGIPPTAGFFMKLYPLLSMANYGSWYVIFLIVWPFITLSAYVYARVIVLLFFRNVDLWNVRSWRPTVTTDTVTGWIAMFTLIYLASYVVQPSLVSYVVLLLN